MQEHKSVYSAGANDGLIMGLYLSAIFLLQAIGMHNQILLYLGEILLLCTPIIAYILIRRAYNTSKVYGAFSALWLHGIIMFLCGSIIMALVMYLYMRIANPGFIVDQIQMIADTYRSLGTAEATEIANTFEKIIDKKIVPTPISMAFSMIWLTGFMGSILSLILAALVRALNKRKQTLN